MKARDLIAGLKGEGVKGSSPIRVLHEDGSISDILMVEADSDVAGTTIYLKVEVED
jgi:hypothetical protein